MSGKKQYEAAQVPPWGWQGTFKEFRSLTLRRFLHSLLLHLQKRWSDSPLSLWQVNSWLREYEIFQLLLEQLCVTTPTAENAIICFEYELPLELGERPDVLLYLPNGVTFVIECKGRNNFLAADLEQVRGYKQRLELFHSAREVQSVLLLLKERIAKEVSPHSGDVALADASSESIERLRAWIHQKLDGAESSSPPKSLPFECYCPLANVVVSAAQAISHLVPATREISILEEHLFHRVNEAQANAEHVLLVVSGELQSGKSACALRTVARSSAFGIPSLFLVGDQPLPKDVRAYMRDVGELIGKTEVSTLARGIGQFVRLVTRPSQLSPFNFIAFDNIESGFISTSAFPPYESALVEFADEQDWSVVLIFVSFEGEFWGGNFAESIRHWFQYLLSHDRKHHWNFACAQPFGVAESHAAAHGITIAFDSGFYLGRKHLPPPAPAGELDVSSEARLHFNCDIRNRNQERWRTRKEKIWRSYVETEQDTSLTMDLVWSRRFLTYKVGQRGVAFIHEIATLGNLKDIPPSMLTWDVLSLEEDELGRTPIRHAAKYGWIDQIPPSAVAAHFGEVSRIARDAVDNSGMHGRNERRIATHRWLIKVAIAQMELQGGTIEQIALQIDRLADEAVASGTLLKVPDVPIFTDNEVSESTEMLLQRYLRDSNETYLDSAIFEAYLTRLVLVAPGAKDAVNEVRAKKRPGRRVSETNGRDGPQCELL